MSFCSVLFERAEDAAGVDGREVPSFFRDLNLDQVIDSITAGREEYSLKPFFYAPLRDVAAVTYRHHVLRDLEYKMVSEPIRSFAEQMRSMRQHLIQAEKLRYR